ncbi:hypothetical protein Tco_1407953 [Tanacetum coccineum]
MLQRCEDTNLVLNWEKCHFMVKEGIVIGYKISKSGIEVDKAKVDVIAKVASSHNREGIRRFLQSPPDSNHHDLFSKEALDILEACIKDPLGTFMVDKSDTARKVTHRLSTGRITHKQDFSDCEDSGARGFALHPQEFHILSFILGIRHPNLID